MAVKCHPCRGFTLLELIVVITLIGVISISAYSRFANSNAFALRVERDRLISILQLAQQTALSGQQVQFQIQNGTPQVYRLKVGASLEDFQVASIRFDDGEQKVRDGITLSPSSLTMEYVNRLGEPDSTPTITLSDDSGDSLAVCVSAAGLAYAC